MILNAFIVQKLTNLNTNLRLFRTGNIKYRHWNLQCYCVSNRVICLPNLFQRIDTVYYIMKLFCLVMILPGNSAKFPNIFGTLSVDLEYILLRKLSVIKIIWNNIRNFIHSAWRFKSTVYFVQIINFIWWWDFSLIMRLNVIWKSTGLCIIARYQKPE